MNAFKDPASTAQGAIEATPAGATTTAKTLDFIPVGLEQGIIYKDSDLDEDGYEEVYLSCNRNINAQNIAAKKVSIVKSKGVISPSLIVAGRAAINQKIEIRNAAGVVIDESYPNLDKTYLRADGAHRSLAINELRYSHKELSDTLHNYCYLPLNLECDIITVLHASNTATCPWNNIDYISSVLMTRSGSDADMSKLKWIKEKSQVGSSTAAFRWADLNTVRIPTKSKLSKAATNDAVFNDVADLGNFHHGVRLYKSMAKSFSPAFLGLKCVPEFFIEIIGEAVKGSKTYAQVIDYIDNFIVTFDRELADEMEKYKSERGVQTKDAKITAKFKALYAAYQILNPLN